MVNVAHIEGTCLARSRQEAEDLHSRYPGALSRVYTCDMFSVIKYRCVSIPPSLVLLAMVIELFPSISGRAEEVPSA